MNSLRKSVLITGCSAGGIGGALADAFHAKGYHVFATARNPSKVSPSLSSAANVKVLKVDVLSTESIAAAVESVKSQTGGGLDVLVNNSGGGYTLPALDVSIEESKKLFELNFWAPWTMLQAFAPLLIKTKGCIVNSSSVNAIAPMSLMSAFTTAPRLLFSRPVRHGVTNFNLSEFLLLPCLPPRSKPTFFLNILRPMYLMIPSTLKLGTSFMALLMAACKRME
ncbi:short chain dehydrogenase [Fusarium oxysporum f. sp. phaseoli]